MLDKRPDRLSALIQRFRVEARVHLPNGADTAAGSGPASNPNLFILQQGRLTLSGTSASDLEVSAPALLFFSRAVPTGFGAQDDSQDAVYVCATVDSGGANPIALALPDMVAVPLQEATPLRAVTDILLEEALAPRCGGGAVIDRLCEIVFIRLLRYLIEEGKTQVGLVAGLANPNLSPAIVAIHENPERKWRLEDLAEIAAMSRTHFANRFRDVVGITPGEYLSAWRLTLARKELADGGSLKVVAGKVGFSSSAALSRAFTRRYGVSPRHDLVRSP